MVSGRLTHLLQLAGNGARLVPAQAGRGVTPLKEGGEEPLAPGGAAPVGNQLPVNTGFCGARPGRGQVSKQTPAREDEVCTDVRATPGSGERLCSQQAVDRS